MKSALSLMSIMLASALALSIKRQNDVPMCEKGKFSDQSGPYSSVSQCLDKCYMTEEEGERVGQICKGHCTSVPLIGMGGVSVGCFNTDR